MLSVKHYIGIDGAEAQLEEQIGVGIENTLTQFLSITSI